MIRAAAGTRILAALFVAGLAIASPVAAQEATPAPQPASPPQAAPVPDVATRADAAKIEREAKSQQLEPYKPGRLERALIALENDRALERLLAPAEGLYPKVGSITAGGGLSAGPAYRHPNVFGSPVAFSVLAMASLRRYWLVDARFTMGEAVEDRLFGDLHAQATDFPREDYFGPGPRSLRSAQVTYGLQNVAFGVTGGFRVRPWLIFTGRLDHLAPDVNQGAHGLSIEQVFDPSDVPGLDDQPDFLKYEAVAEINYREPRGNPRKGGRYALVAQLFDDRAGHQYDFRRIEADLQQYINLYKERRVLALHALVSVSDATAGGDVPFYYQRTLGGPDDLRGFRRHRFRDRNLVLLQAEYRWEIFTAVDGAIFYDTGMVASRPEDLSLGDLESDYGIGFRFGTIKGIFLRVEGAFGSSGGKHFVLRLGHVF